MNRFILAGLLLLALAGCVSAPSSSSPSQPVSSSLGASPSIPGLPSSSPSPGGTSVVLRQVHDPGQVTGTLTGPCHTRDAGQLPDPLCTPGSYDPAISAAILCSGTYRTSSYRPPSSQTTAFKYGVSEPAYGERHVPGELDHLVSLELGGSNDASNLWVETGSIPNPKDAVENALHDWVCAGGAGVAQGRLASAQVAIAYDWLTAEQVLHIGG
jgi:hypothetical protein